MERSRGSVTPKQHWSSMSLYATGWWSMCHPLLGSKESSTPQWKHLPPLDSKTDSGWSLGHLGLVICFGLLFFREKKQIRKGVQDGIPFFESLTNNHAPPYPQRRTLVFRFLIHFAPSFQIRKGSTSSFPPTSRETTSSLVDGSPFCVVFPLPPFPLLLQTRLLERDGSFQERLLSHHPPARLPYSSRRYRV